MQPLLNALGPFFGGPANVMILLLAVVKIAIVFAMVMGIAPFLVLYERKLLGWIQERPGPNRVGPWGILQGLIDGAKLFLKEELVPANVDKVLYYLGPTIIASVAVLALTIIPFGVEVSPADTAAFYHWLGVTDTTGFPSRIPLAITDLPIAVLFLFGVTAIGVYGITLAGWSSNNFPPCESPSRSS